VKRGIKVKLHTNSMASNNHLSAFVAYRKQRNKLIKSGAELYEMRPDSKIQRELYTPEELERYQTISGLHVKTMVFDRKRVFVGSFNLDPRSIHLNTEMGLLVESEALGQAVAASIENDIAPGNSWRVMHDTAGKTAWVTIVNGAVSEPFRFEPMTTAGQRAKADAIDFIPDTGQM
jgi:putative cardiolipin synthase